MTAPDGKTTGHRKLAVIAGGLGYVGSSIAKRLAQSGMRIVLLYRNKSSAEVDEALGLLPGKGHAALACDIAQERDVHATFARIAEEITAPDVCIFAAGTMPLAKPLHRLQEAELRKEFDKDVFPAFNFLSVSAQTLKENAREGVIIAITTAGVASSSNTKARGAYSAIKFAQQGMLQALKEELAPSGIRVYSIAPGVMPGGLNRDTPRAFLDMVREKIPGKRLAEADDVAEIALFLSSEQSRNTTDLTILAAPEVEGY